MFEMEQTAYNLTWTSHKVLILNFTSVFYLTKPVCATRKLFSLISSKSMKWERTSRILQKINSLKLSFTETTSLYEVPCLNQKTFINAFTYLPVNHLNNKKNLYSQKKRTIFFFLMKISCKLNEIRVWFRAYEIYSLKCKYFFNYFVICISNITLLIIMSLIT